MVMKGRSTLVLFIGILLLGSFIFIQELWWAKVPSKAYRRVQFFDLSLDTLTSLQFQYTNRVIECVKENGIWMTGSAEQGLGPADVALIHKLVAGLNSMGKGTTITAQHLEMRGLDASEYGLANPALRIKALDNQGEHHWFIGRKAPLAEMLYAQQGEDEDIYTIPLQLMDLVPSQADSLRDRTLFSGKIPSVRRIEIRGGEGFLQILKNAQGRWEFMQPVSAPADAKAIDTLLAQLYRLRVEEFLVENVSDFAVYGLQSEMRQISLSGAKGVSRMLVIGDEIAARPGLVYARRADDTSVFAVKAEVFDELNIKLDALRDARVISLPLHEISSISVARGTDLLELVAADSGVWKMKSRVSWAIDKEAVSQLLKLWDAAVITEFSGTHSTIPPEWTLEFGSIELGQTNRIEVLPAGEAKDGLWIRRNGKDTIFQINLPLIPDSIGIPLEYKSRLVWKLDPERLQKITVEKRGGLPQVIERQPDGEFAPEVSAARVQGHSERIARLLDALAQISTQEYVVFNPHDLSLYGLTDPFLSLRLSGTDQLGRVLLIGRETSHGFYAMVKGWDTVFILDKSLVEILAADLVLQSDSIPLPTQ